MFCYKQKILKQQNINKIFVLSEIFYLFILLIIIILTTGVNAKICFAYITQTQPALVEMSLLNFNFDLILELVNMYNKVLQTNDVFAISADTSEIVGNASFCLINDVYNEMKVYGVQVITKPLI